MSFRPQLVEVERDGITLLSDPDAAARGVHVWFTDRRGGVSPPPYDSLNLAARVGDDPAAVEENRRRVAEAAGFDVDDLALVRQVHGRAVCIARAGDGGVVGEADAVVIEEPGPVAAILTADCAPVVVTGSQRVAVAHAGWRGLAAGVVGEAVERAGLPAIAWIGPAIRACCYAVGPEVVAAFERAELPVAGSARVDPPIAAEAALRQAGVADVAASDACTSCDERYYSYRRDDTTGRQGALAMLETSPPALWG